MIFVYTDAILCFVVLVKSITLEQLLSHPFAICFVHGRTCYILNFVGNGKNGQS